MSLPLGPFVRLSTLIAAFVGLCLLPRPSRGDDEPGRTRPRVPPTAAAPVPDEPPVDPRCTRPVVFLYHGFGRGTGQLSVESSTLEEHLTWLETNRVPIVSMAKFVDFLHGQTRLPPRAAVLTIDDGDETVYTRAWPVLRRHGAPFVLGLPTRLMEFGARGMMSWEQVREMVDSGLAEVASHGHEHRGLVHMPASRAARELALSRRIIETRTGRAPIAFFYPLGSANERTESYVRDAGFDVAFTAQGAPIVQTRVRPYRIPRVTVMHRHALRGLAWFYGPKFWQVASRWQDGCR